ncbi:MAG: hypothetical protein CEN90_49 [Parcubacteria group bacterium Licking1014_17]|nr:MAG: hypothetical protein CEN90_49 [Parcubacteria group bacterium Licking1014_17]
MSHYYYYQIMNHKKKELIVAVFILFTAAFFRFNNLAATPPGLYPDEAINGNEAIQAYETGNYKVFYKDNNGREGLYINLLSIATNAFGNKPWVLRLIPALAGTLTVLGLYLLVKQLFNWQTAAFASFLLAISFWHVLFSRIAFAGILAPLFLVWALYFFWLGLARASLWDFGASGLLFGLGLQTYLPFRVAPLIAIITLVVYWATVRKHVAVGAGKHASNYILRGLGLTIILGILAAAPLVWYFMNNPGMLFYRAGQVSVFSADNPLWQIIANAGKTIAMFFTKGDLNWRHNLSGSAMLIWPVGILFLIGVIRSIVKTVKSKEAHGHHSAAHAMLLSWLVIGLLPGIFSNEGIPHALRTILVTPVVCIFAAETLWWIFTLIEKRYHEQDPKHEKEIPGFVAEDTFIATIAICILLFSFSVVEYDKYFNKWAKDPNTAAAFNENYVKLADKVYLQSLSKPVYVLVKAGGVQVNGIPMPAQTVMFLTDTFTLEKQKQRNIYYVTPKLIDSGYSLPKNAVVIPLE